MNIVWLILITIVASVLCSFALYRLVSEAYRVPDWFPVLTLVLSLSAHISVAYFMLAENAAIVISVSALFWSLLFHFLYNRFSVPPIPIVWTKPVSFISFVSSEMALVYYMSAMWAVLPILIWLILGFITAEISIRKSMSIAKKMGDRCDRAFWCFALCDRGEEYQFGSIRSLYRYPFP